MLSLFLINNKELNYYEGSDSFNLEIDSKECFENIEECRVCCSTPTNKLATVTNSYLSRTADGHSGDHNIQVKEFLFPKNHIEFSSVPICSKIINNSINIMISQNTNSKILCSTQTLNSKLKEVKESENSPKDLSKRQDVINKASLRHMRKYYVDLFKKKNSKIVRARFCNVRSTEAMNAVKRTFSTEFETDTLPEEFYYYLLGVLKIKDISRMNCSYQTKSDVFDFLDCCRRYSKAKFESLFKNPCLKLLCENFASINPPTEKYRSLIQNH